MVAVHFYHLTTSPLERALPKLLEKAYEAGFRTLVIADEERIARLDDALWTYHPQAFLPHGTEKDGNVERQPILIIGLDPMIEQKLGSWITSGDASKNVLCLTNGYHPESTEGYARILDVFDGARAESLAAARTRWKQYKEGSYELTYYQQTEAGGWEKK